jgi:mono/diheme cytochrome c family protein
MRRNVLLALLFLLLGVVALGAAGCGGEEEVSPTAENAEDGDTTEAETEEEGDGDGAAAEGDAEAGADIYNEQACGGCHTLEAAGSSGSIGPNLDESQPDFELVVERVTNGSGAMPSFSDKLSEDEINNVAAYVVESTG